MALKNVTGVKKTQQPAIEDSIGAFDAAIVRQWKRGGSYLTDYSQKTFGPLIRPQQIRDRLKVVTDGPEHKALLMLQQLAGSIQPSGWNESKALSLDAVRAYVDQQVAFISKPPPIPRRPEGAPLESGYDLPSSRTQYYADHGLGPLGRQVELAQKPR